MIDLGTGNNNKINWAIEDKQEVIDMALSPSVFPPKTSRHHYDGFDMNSDLPEIDVPLHALSGGTGYVRAEFQA